MPQNIFKVKMYIDVQKPVVFLYTNNYQSEKEENNHNYNTCSIEENKMLKNKFNQGGERLTTLKTTKHC